MERKCVGWLTGISRDDGLWDYLPSFHEVGETEAGTGK